MHESGATLVLALLFLVVIGLIVGGLASWTSNDLSNSLRFQQDRSAQYALSSTTQVAIQNIRYAPLLGSKQTLNASPPSYCWGPTPAAGTGTVSELTVLNYQVAVWCSTVWTPTSASTRVVTVSACLTSVVPTPVSGSSLASVQAAALQCAGSPGLQTLVTFDDYSTANPSVNPGVCIPPPNGTCGQGMTVNSSTIGTLNPTVTSLSTNVGPLTGGTTVNLTGTGFVTGATVNFIATNLSSNIVFPGVGVTVNSSTSLSVTTPPATTVTTYYVIVSTTDGSSQAGLQAQFTYQPVIPTVTSITTASGGTSGSAAGGTSITISGTGFLSPVAGDNTKVNFIDTANNSIVLQAPYLTVNGYVNGVQTITATTPGIVQDTTYYVTVTTFPAGGTERDGAHLHVCATHARRRQRQSDLGRCEHLHHRDRDRLREWRDDDPAHPAVGQRFHPERNQRHGVVVHDPHRHRSFRRAEQRDLLRDDHDHERGAQLPRLELQFGWVGPHLHLLARSPPPSAELTRCGPSGLAAPGPGREGDLRPWKGPPNVAPCKEGHAGDGTRVTEMASSRTADRKVQP